MDVQSALIGGHLLAAGLNLEGLELLRNPTSWRTHRLVQTKVAAAPRLKCVCACACVCQRPHEGTPELIPEPVNPGQETRPGLGGGTS